MHQRENILWHKKSEQTKKEILEQRFKGIEINRQIKGGYPLDVWGNTFIYKEAKQGIQASLTSKGKDGLDNGKLIRISFPIKRIIREQ